MKRKRRFRFKKTVSRSIARIIFYTLAFIIFLFCLAFLIIFYPLYYWHEKKKEAEYDNVINALQKLRRATQNEIVDLVIGNGGPRRSFSCQLRESVITSAIFDLWFWHKEIAFDEDQEIKGELDRYRARIYYLNTFGGPRKKPKKQIFPKITDFIPKLPGLTSQT